MEQNDEVLVIQDLKVVYDTEEQLVQAVNGIDLVVRRGQTTGLVGETGAGKTTTALSILRLLPERTGKIVNGHIYYNGEDLAAKSKNEMRAIRGEKISMIFQDPMTSLNPIMTVGQQIMESLIIHNTERQNKNQLKSRVDEILNLVGIPSRRKHEYPHQFSGGMKQRIVIAIALACQPELLIADEPTTALDVTIQAQVLALMCQLQEQLNTAMIIITHDLGVIAQTCNYVAVMYAGEIVEYGSVENIFNGALHHPYTEGLFGAIPDLVGRIDRLTPIEGLMPDPAKLPAGCKFHPRCKYCKDICKSAAPHIYKHNGHTIRCHLFNEEK